MSLSTRERGLKFCDDGHLSSPRLSLSTRERGLKYGSSNGIADTDDRRSLRESVD